MEFTLGGRHTFPPCRAPTGGISDKQSVVKLAEEVEYSAAGQEEVRCIAAPPTTVLRYRPQVAMGSRGHSANPPVHILTSVPSTLARRVLKAPGGRLVDLLKTIE